jgi:hypothetical protein
MPGSIASGSGWQVTVQVFQNIGLKVISGPYPAMWPQDLVFHRLKKILTRLLDSGLCQRRWFGWQVTELNYIDFLTTGWAADL